MKDSEGSQLSNRHHVATNCIRLPDIVFMSWFIIFSAHTFSGFENVIRGFASKYETGLSNQRLWLFSSAGVVPAGQLELLLERFLQ